MALSVHEIEREIDRLTVGERAQLATYILASLEPPGDMDGDIEAAWAREIEGRVAAYDRGELEPISADEVFAEARRRST